MRNLPGGKRGCWDGVGGGNPLSPRPLHFTSLPPVLFSSQMGLHLREGPWKALPKASQSGRGHFLSAKLRLPLRHTPFWTQRGFPRAVSSAGSVSASARLCKVPFRFSAPSPCSHQAIAQARKDSEDATYRSAEKEARSAGCSPAAFHFRFASQPQLERRLGEEIWEKG